MSVFTETLPPEASEAHERGHTVDIDLVEKIATNGRYWKMMETLFDPNLTGERLEELKEHGELLGEDGPAVLEELAIRSELAGDDLQELRRMELDELLENPGEALIAYIQRVRHDVYQSRIKTVEDSGVTIESFGTRNKKSDKLDDLFEIRDCGDDGNEYRYSAPMRDRFRLHPPIYTVKVSDSGEYAVYLEYFLPNKNGDLGSVVEELEGEARDARVREMLENSIVANKAVHERDKAQNEAADQDSLGRLERLGRMREKYLYHVA